jgi:hypothetical protein
LNWGSGGCKTGVSKNLRILTGNHKFEEEDFYPNAL